MGNELQIFNYGQNQVRTVTKDGEPWFVAKDVAEALGYSNTSKAINAHCKAVETCPTEMGGQVRHIQIIPERDVYRLIMRSKLPTAERFEEWVVGEVLPAIRKHGGYLTPEKVEEVLLSPDTIIRLATELKSEREQRVALEDKVQQDRPKVMFSEAVTASRTSILIGGLAKILKQNGIEIGQNRLFEWMRENGYLMRSGSSRNMPTQRSMEAGLFQIKETAITHSDGNIDVKRTPKVTGKGQRHFISLFLDQEQTG